MKKILKNVLLFSALIGSVNCLALPAAAVDVATATSYMETTDDSKYPSSGTCASGATWTYDYPNRELHISGSTIRIDEMPQLPCRKIVFEKDFIPPENKFYEHTDLNTFVMSITLRSPNEIRQIYCYPNSPFAKEYEKIIASTEDDGCSYADVFCNYLPDDTGICGDVNLDGKVNLLDSVLLAKAVNGSVTVNDMQKKNMDCDGSGEIDIDDVTTLMQFLVHAVDSLPVK